MLEMPQDLARKKEGKRNYLIEKRYHKDLKRIGEEKEITGIHTGKEEIKLSVCTWHDCSAENYKESTK